MPTGFRFIPGCDTDKKNFLCFPCPLEFFPVFFGIKITIFISFTSQNRYILLIISYKLQPEIQWKLEE